MDAHAVIGDRMRSPAKMESEESMEELLSVVNRIKAVEEFSLADDGGDCSSTPCPEMTRRHAEPKLTTIRIETESITRLVESN
ncbi:hypothetical protein Aduo_018534 [Ancylostoma duodenale]